MFENRRRGRQARNFTTNAPKIIDLKSSSEQIFSRKLPLGAPASTTGKPGSVIVPQYDSCKITLTVFVSHKFSILKFVGNTK